MPVLYQELLHPYCALLSTEDPSFYPSLNVKETSFEGSAYKGWTFINAYQTLHGEELIKRDTISITESWSNLGFKLGPRWCWLSLHVHPIVSHFLAAWHKLLYQMNCDQGNHVKHTALPAFTDFHNCLHLQHFLSPVPFPCSPLPQAGPVSSGHAL